MTRNRLDFLVVTSDYHAKGGIPAQTRLYTEVLQQAGRTKVLAVETAAVAWKLRLVARLAFSLAVGRPSLLFFSHVRLARMGAFARRLGFRYVVLAWGDEIWSDLDASAEDRRRKVLAGASGVWPCSNFTGRWVRQKSPRALVSSGLYGDAMLRGGAGVPAPCGPVLRIVSVCRMESLADKGVDLVLKAVALARERATLKVVMVGDGQELPLLRAAVEQLGLSEVVDVVGLVSDDRLSEIYRQSDVCVLFSRFRRSPSATGEGLGLVLLEAAAHGVIPVASDAGGAPEAVGEAGFLVPGEDAVALSALLVRLAGDRALCWDRKVASIKMAGGFTRERFDERVLTALRATGFSNSFPGSSRKEEDSGAAAEI